MNNLINELISILNQEAEVYDDVLQISKNKTKIVVEGKVTELESVVKLEQSLVLQLGRLETRREDIIQKLADILGMEQSEISVSVLMPHVQGEEAKTLKACQESIVGKVGELKSINELNSRLIKNSLDYIDFSINLMSSATDVNNNYGSTGEVSSSKRKNFFDMKL